MSSVLDLEQRSIELQIREVQLERKLNDLQMKRLLEKKTPTSEVPKNKELPKTGLNTSTFGANPVNSGLHLHYNNSIKKSLMRIAEVNADGSIGIYGKKDCVMISKQYTVQSLKWICKKLPVWSKRQKVERRFFDNVAGEYSRKFTKVSDTTMEKLCYLVDSGCFDVWFEKYSQLKSRQVTLGV